MTSNCYLISFNGGLSYLNLIKKFALQQMSERKSMSGKGKSVDTEFVGSVHDPIIAVGTQKERQIEDLQEDENMTLAHMATLAKKSGDPKTPNKQEHSIIISFINNSCFLHFTLLITLLFNMKNYIFFARCKEAERIIT